MHRLNLRHLVGVVVLCCIFMQIFGLFPAPSVTMAIPLSAVASIGEKHKSMAGEVLPPRIVSGGTSQLAAINYDRAAAASYQATYAPPACSPGTCVNNDTHRLSPGDGAHYAAHVLQAGGFPIHYLAGQDDTDPIVYSVTAQRNYLISLSSQGIITTVPLANQLEPGDYIHMTDGYLGGTCGQAATVIWVDAGVPWVTTHSIDRAPIPYDQVQCPLGGGWEFWHVLDPADPRLNSGLSLNPSTQVAGSLVVASFNVHNYGDVPLNLSLRVTTNGGGDFATSSCSLPVGGDCGYNQTRSFVTAGNYTVYAQMDRGNGWENIPIASGASNPVGLAVNNPTPFLTTLGPSSAMPGGASFTLVVTGTNFVNGSVVRWNGANRTTTFVSSTQLQAAISAADIATSGSASVTVFNPSPGGGMSNALTFTFNNPWTFMVYLNGDNSLDKDTADLFNRLESVADQSSVRIVVLWDRLGNGSTCRYLVQHDNNRYQLGTYAEGVNRWCGPEADMGDPVTLITFINEAKRDFPANHYFLSVVDHGGGWAPEIPSQSPHASGWKFGGAGLSWDDTDGSYLSTHDIGEVFRNVGHLDVVYFDACLMAMLENADELKTSVDYFIASQNVEYAVFPYDSYVRAITTTTTPATLSTDVANIYFASLPSAASGSISVLRLASTDTVVSATNQLAQALAPLVSVAASREQIASAYLAAQKVDYDADTQLEPAREGFVDLYDFARQISLTVNNTTAIAAAHQVMSALDSGFIQLEQHRAGGWYSGDQLAGLRGVSVYLPFGEEFYIGASCWVTPTLNFCDTPPIACVMVRQYYTTTNPYQVYQLSFAQDTQWDEFVQQFVAAYYPCSAPVLRPNWLNGVLPASRVINIHTQAHERPTPLPLYAVYLPILMDNYTPVSADFVAIPAAGIAPLKVVFTNTAHGAYTSSLWDFGDGVTSTLQNPTHTYAISGTFSVTLTVSNAAETSTRACADCIRALDTPPDLIVNGGFEENLAWEINNATGYAGYTSAPAHLGLSSMRLGVLAYEPLSYGFDSVSQLVTIPSGATNVTLSFWYWPRRETGTAPLTENRQIVQLLDTNYNVLQILWVASEELFNWDRRIFDLGAYAGQTIYIQFAVFNNGNFRHKRTAMFIDDITLQFVPGTLQAVPRRSDYPH
jgi:PKD repeat protein